MKRSKFSDSQIIDAVKRVESGIGVPDICRQACLSYLQGAGAQFTDQASQTPCARETRSLDNAKRN